MAPAVPNSESAAERHALTAGLIEASPVAMMVHREGRILYVNGAGARLLGARRARDLVGTPLSDLVPPEYRTILSRRVQQVQKDGRASPMEQALLRLDGSRVHVEVTGQRVRYDGQEAVLVVVHDISERRQAQDARARLASIVESSDAAILGLDTDGTITAWNPGAERVFGYPAAQAVGSHLSMLLPPESRTRWRSLLAMVLPDHPVSRRDAVRMDAHGHRIHVAETMSQILDPTGQLVGYSCVSWDVTEQVRAQRENAALMAVANAASGDRSLRQILENAVRALHGSLPYAITLLYLTDFDDRRLSLSIAYGITPKDGDAMRAYSLDDAPRSVAARTVAERRVIVVQDVRKVAPESMETQLERGCLVSVPLVLGKECLGVLQVVTGKERQPGDGEVATLRVASHYLALAIQERRLVRRLHQTVDELKEANRELDGFVHAASHDLSEPLRSMLSFSNLLLEQNAGHLPAASHDHLERIHRGALRLRTMLDGLMAYSRVTRRQEAMEEVAVDRLVAEVEESLHAALKDRDATVTVTDPLPMVQAPRHRLFTVFLNLVGNAIKFNASPAPRVRIGCRTRKTMHEFWVEDNGIGIPEGVGDRVFELFARAHNREEYPGTGTGLAIVAKCVEGWGGGIRYDAVPGGGTVFRFTVPRTPRAAEADGSDIDEGPDVAP